MSGTAEAIENEGETVVEADITEIDITPARKKITVMACEDLTPPAPPLLQGEGGARTSESVTPHHMPPAPPLLAGEGVGG